MIINNRDYDFQIERAVLDLLSGVSYEDVRTDPCGVFSVYVQSSGNQKLVHENLILAYEAKHYNLYGVSKPS